jgi:uncharacterized protein (DUF1697 family)
MSPASAGVHLALLRGINVGGKNRLPMKDLVDIFEEIGAVEVQTYIQSGNVLFRCPAGKVGKLPGEISAAIRRRFGFTIPVILRTASEIRSVVRGNPFLAATVDPGRLHVAFLSDRPARQAVARLDPDRSPPDRFLVKGKEIYLHCPRGMARTKLTNDYFDRELATTSTMRNWTTVLTLAGLAGA